MKETIYIRLTGASDAPKAWLVEGERGRDQGRASLEAIAGRAKGRRVIVLVPGIDALLASVKVPTRKRQRVLQALPFALEERLAGDVEALHFAVGTIEADGTAHAAVVSRERMDRWLEELRTAGIEPDAMYPDTISLPFTPEGWSLLVEPGQALLRTAADAGVAADGDAFADILTLALENAATPPGHILAFDCREDTDAPLSVLDETVELRLQPCLGALAVLAQGVGQSRPVDLLQGEYGRREKLGRHWYPWRHAAGLAAAVLVVQAGVSLHHWWELSRETSRLEAAIMQTYRDAFPQESRVIDPPRQMQQHLDRLRRGGGQDRFADLLARVGPVLKGTSGLRLEGLRYRSDQLEIDLTLGDLQSLDGLKQRLAAAGDLSVDIASASARDDRVESRLTIRQEGA